MKISKQIKLTPTVALMVALGASTAWGSERKLDSHEHGVSGLKIAQEGNKISFELEAPGDDIVGFEREPKNDAEKASIETALAQLRKPENLFSMPEAAKCTVSENEAEFETSKDHAGFHVTWSMTCETISEANTMKVGFFDMFSNAKEVEVEAIGEAGQMSAEVEKGTASVDLSTVVGN